jgi:Cd2+/Zn2+-exporting ATPase
VANDRKSPGAIEHDPEKWIPVHGKQIFLGSPNAAGEIAALDAEQRRQIMALNNEGKTVSVLLVDKVPAGAIAMRDEPRPDAATGLKMLTDAGGRVVMLTGDNRRTATAIGSQLGIEVEAELMPQDKQRIVGQFRKTDTRSPRSATA